MAREQSSKFESDMFFEDQNILYRTRVTLTFTPKTVEVPARADADLPTLDAWNRERTVFPYQDLPLTLDLWIAGVFSSPILQPAVTLADLTQHVQANDGSTVHCRADTTLPALQ